MVDYVRPTTIEEAVSALNRLGGKAVLLAGGTDLLPRWSKGVLERPASIVDLKKIDVLREVSRENGQIRVGACVSVSELAAEPAIQSTAPVLAQAAGRIACPQIRNRATVGGNLCNASPAADTALPLILLDAVVELVCSDGNRISTRHVPIADFFRGPGSTVLGPAELLTCIRYEPLPENTFADWDKFGTRPSMEIAVASVGLALTCQEGTITRARVGYGSVAPVPLRGVRAEAELVGNVLAEATIARCEDVARQEIAPITDVRAGEGYRREIVGVMLRRMLERAAGTGQD
jgi:CO/xanthine dehydrogenase FAD-binding subunit